MVPKIWHKARCPLSEYLLGSENFKQLESALTLFYIYFFKVGMSVATSSA